MNFEGGACFFIVLLIAIRCARAPADWSSMPWRPSRPLDLADAMVVMVIGLGVFALFWRAAHIGFLSDDFVMMTHAAEFRARPVFSTGGGDGFYRPLIYAFLSWTWRWAGLDTWKWHLAGIAIHVLNATLIYLVAWALGFSRYACGFAAALFAVHATRPEVALWITGRADLFPTLFVLFALFFWIRAWDAAPARAFLDRGIAMLAMTGGLLSKESAYAFPVMLVVMLAFNAKWRRKPATYLPFFLAAALIFAWRWHLLAGIGGYRTATGTPEVLSLNAFGLLKGFALRLWAVLFFPINWSIRPGVVLATIGLIYAAALVTLPAIRVKRAPFFITLALLVASVAPTLHLLRIGPDLEKARYLYLPSAMFALMIAVILDASRWKWLLAAVFLVFQCAALIHNLGAWEFSASKAAQTCAIVADSARAPGAKIAVVGVPQTLEGAYFFANGLPECVQLQNGRRADITMILDASKAVDPAAFTRVLRWDPATDSLKTQP